jgi:hypothetical protein
MALFDVRETDMNLTFLLHYLNRTPHQVLSRQFCQLIYVLLRIEETFVNILIFFCSSLKLCEQNFKD